MWGVWGERGERFLPHLPTPPTPLACPIPHSPFPITQIPNPLYGYSHTQTSRYELRCLCQQCRKGDSFGSRGD
nr:hypothetical protein [Nostoc sp. ChiSLP01]